MQLYLRNEAVRFWLICLGVFVCIETLDRLAVLVWAAATETGLTPALLAALPFGMLDDISVGLVLGAPFLAAIFILAPMWRRRWMVAAGHVAFFAMLLLLVFSESSEIFFWNEFDSRFNSIAVNYLIFPREVIGNIRESFNLPLFLPVVVAVALALYWSLRRPLRKALAMELRPDLRYRMVGASAVAFVLGILGMTAMPINVFADRAVNEVAKNGLHSLFHAAVTNDQDFDGLYLTMDQKEATSLVRQMVAQDNVRFLGKAGETERPNLLRHVDNPPLARPLNVVFALEESFGSTYVDDLDSIYHETISPNLVRLARDGLFFTNIYATGNRTVRALEAILTSFPPIPGMSTARRPGSDGMNSLPFLLKTFGYKTALLYGGQPVFDNMGHFWSAIGFDQVIGQSEIAEQGFSTIWGVADEFLFTEALRRMDQLTEDGRPVYLNLLTVSNHRPYVYPEGRIDKDAKLKRRENAATYADWAFGDFIERARSRPWFKDTVFVFIGDHGPRVYGAGQVPVPSYRVPLLFYAPAHIAPERNATLGSSMDVAPTLLSLLGLSYDSPFFGVDLRLVSPGGGRIVMEHNFSVALGDGRDVAMLLPGREKRGWSMTVGPHELVPQVAPREDLLRQTIALYQSAHRMFYGHDYHEMSGQAPGAPPPGHN